MPLYETVFITRQDLSPAQNETLIQNFTQIVSDNGGQIVKTENWGLRKLMYKIRKNNKGHYTLFQMDAPAAALHEMERQMRLNEDVLRQLTIKIDEIEEGQSAILRQKERDDNDRSMSDRYRGEQQDFEPAFDQTAEA